MRTGSHTVAVKPATGTDGGNMRPGVHAMIADTGAGTNHRSDMAAGGDTVTADAGTCARTPGMTAHAYAMFAGMHICPHAQHTDAEIDGIGGRNKQGHGAKRGGKKMFHGRWSFIRAVP
jgi:hypothetical protein